MRNVLVLAGTLLALGLLVALSTSIVRRRRDRKYQLTSLQNGVKDIKNKLADLDGKVAGVTDRTAGLAEQVAKLSTRVAEAATQAELRRLRHFASGLPSLVTRDVARRAGDKPTRIVTRYSSAGAALKVKKSSNQTSYTNRDFSLELFWIHTSTTGRATPATDGLGGFFYARLTTRQWTQDPPYAQAEPAGEPNSHPARDIFAETLENRYVEPELQGALSHWTTDRFNGPMDLSDQLSAVSDRMVHDPVAALTQSLGLSPAPADLLGDVAAAVPLPIDAPLTSIRRVVEITGVVAGVLTGAPVLANACVKALVHDEVSHLASQAIGDALGRLATPSSLRHENAPGDVAIKAERLDVIRTDVTTEITRRRVTESPAPGPDRIARPPRSPSDLANEQHWLATPPSPSSAPHRFGGSDIGGRSMGL
jgi:hypothetical protein